MSRSTVSTDDRVYREDTLDAYQRGVERAIQVMYARLEEPLTVDDLAAAAFMSRYHFTRVFAKITGATPARFLAAIRMQEAKRLLLRTDRSVTDICFDVGYNSLGTFTRIFADFVGFPPVRFRQISLSFIGLATEDVIPLLPASQTPNESPSIKGAVVCDKPLALVTVAIFPTAIPRSHPIECVCLAETRSFEFSCAPPRGARLFSAGMSVAANMEDCILLNDERVFVGTASPLRASDGTLQVRLSVRKCVEPPVVVAFPLLIAESIMARKLSIVGEVAATG